VGGCCSVLKIFATEIAPVKLMCPLLYHTKNFI
jgi:hypothetical protein